MSFRVEEAKCSKTCFNRVYFCFVENILFSINLAKLQKWWMRRDGLKTTDVHILVDSETTKELFFFVTLDNR
jgi:hypothetical protein